MHTITAPTQSPAGNEPGAGAERRLSKRRRGLIGAAIALALLATGGSAGAAFSNSAGAHVADAQGRPPVLPADATVVLLVDVSGSMFAADIKPTRLAADVHATEGFLTRIPASTRVGLVEFSTKAEVVVPPTVDRRLLQNGLAYLTPTGATALGDGLATAVKVTTAALAQQGVVRESGDSVPAEIILASGGVQNHGTLTALQGAQRAKAAGIRVEGISLGLPTGVVKYAYGKQVVKIPVPPDPKTVQRLSAVSGGQSFNATSAASLDAIYLQLASGIG